MFPGIDGFHRTVGHIVFLGLFFAVVLTIATTVISAVWRTVRDFRAHRTMELCWKSDFSELPVADRSCRHELAGRVISRTCDHAFDCRTCTNYLRFAAALPSGVSPCPGLDYPNDRLYHRGHTWVKPEADGTFTIGLDDLADHLIGKPEAVHLPERGSEIELNGTAWRLEKNKKDIRVRAPLDGTVVAVGGPTDNWYVRIRPRFDVNDRTALRHLLRGPEVHGWVSREMERLQLQLRAPNTPPALADGGVLMPGLMDALPEADWNTVLADTFLEV